MDDKKNIGCLNKMEVKMLVCMDLVACKIATMRGRL